MCMLREFLFISVLGDLSDFDIHNVHAYVHIYIKKAKHMYINMLHHVRYILQ